MLAVALFAVLPESSTESVVVAAPPGGSLDEELLREWDAELTDPIERELLAPLAPERPADRADAQALERELERELGEAAVSAGDNPLAEVSRWMRLAEQRLGQSDAGERTQAIQAQILATLDQLVRRREPPPEAAPSGGDEDAEDESASTAEAAGTEPGGEDAPQPSGQSDPDADHPASRQAEVARLRGVMERLWGELPERERQRLLQSPVEQFLPKYETLIEQYYRVLARGREGDR